MGKKKATAKQKSRAIKKARRHGKGNKGN